MSKHGTTVTLSEVMAAYVSEDKKLSERIDRKWARQQTPQVNIGNVVEEAKKQAEGAGYISREELSRRQAEALYGSSDE